MTKLLTANRDYLPDDITEELVKSGAEKGRDPFMTCCMVACSRPNPEEVLLLKEAAKIKEEEEV